MNEIEKKLDEIYYSEYILNGERQLAYDIGTKQFENIKAIYRGWYNDLVEKIKVIMDRQEIANGFQPRGYATEEQEKEIYFDGSDNGRAMMRIDLLNLIKNI